MTKAPLKTKTSDKTTDKKTASKKTAIKTTKDVPLPTRKKRATKKTPEKTTEPAVEAVADAGATVQAVADVNDAATLDVNEAHLAAIAEAGEEGIFFDPMHADPLAKANFITIDSETKDDAGNVAVYITAAGTEYLARSATASTEPETADADALPPHDPETGEVLSETETAPVSDFAAAFEAQQNAAGDPPPPGPETYVERLGLPAGTTLGAGGSLPPEPAVPAAEPTAPVAAVAAGNFVQPPYAVPAGFLVPPALMKALADVGDEGMAVETALAHPMHTLGLVELGNPMPSNSVMTRLTAAGKRWRAPSMFAPGSENFPNAQPRRAYSGGPPLDNMPPGGFTVRNDVAMPTRRRGEVPTRDKYPFNTMEVGESFHVRATADEPKPSLRFASSVTSANKRFKETTPHGQTPKRFIIRGVGKDDPEGVGARIFREV